MRGALALALTLLLVSPARAQEAELEAGRAARAAGDHALALGHFAAAWESSAAPIARAEMAREELALGQFVLAETHASEALAFATDPAIAATSAELTHARDEAAAHLGSIEVRCSAGCSISVDGVSAGTTPLPHLVRVEAGTHTVHAELARARPADTTVDVAAGSVARATLAPEWIDTRPILAQSPDGQRVAGWTGVIAGGLALIIGSVALGVELERDNVLRSDACMPPTMLVTRESQCPEAASVRSTYTDVARAMYVAGAVLAAAGLALLLTAPTSDPARPTARCMPSAAPGFVCQVTF